MKLKKLTLQGYKTFASRTEFLFDEGITAVVGPNGSGKSNIADALRWVLGEQSYSTLRGKRTVDMIFTGSQIRPRAGMAQATLTLDNVDNWLPIDYSEVEISRRAFRSGDNEYILNGQKVRLKDIMDLLATSGLSQRTYTMIGQGLIDQALSIRPDERRALFEEAAGINHYKARRAETLRRLKETQHNLERVHDILAEIKPRLNSLKRQATRARNYDQINQDLRNLLRIWYGFKWDQARTDMRRVRSEALKAEREWRKSRRALLVQQQNIDDLQQQINRAQQRIAGLQEKREDVREQLEQARRQSAILEERKEAIRRQLEDIELQLPALEAQRTAAQEQLAAATDDLSGAQGQLENVRHELRTFKQSFQGQQDEIKNWQEKLATAKGQQRSVRTRLAQAEGQLSQLKARLREQEGEQQGSEPDQLPRLETEQQQHTAALASGREKLSSIRQQRKDVQQRRKGITGDLKKLRQEAKKQQQQLRRQQDQLARLETRVDLLDQMRHKEVSVGDDVELVGSLAGLVNIPARHKTAIEAALSSRLATLVVADAASLWKLVDSEEKQTVSVAAVADIQPPSLPPAPDESDVFGWASDVVTSKKAGQTAADLLLGPVLLLRDRETAYRLAPSLPPGTLAVASDGFVVHAGGLVETGRPGQGEGILSRETAWREAQEALEDARKEALSSETAVSQLQETIQQQQRQVDKLNDEEGQLGRLESESIQLVSTAQRRVDQSTQQHAFLKRQLERLTQEIERLQKQIQALSSQIEKDEATAVRLETTVAEVKARLESLPVAEARQQQQGLQQQIKAAETIVAGRLAVVDSRRTTLRQVEQQLSRLQQRRGSYLTQQATLAQDESAVSQQRLQDQRLELEAAIKPLQTRLNEHRTELLAIQTRSGAMQRQAHETETRYTQTQVRFSQQESQIESLQERIHTDLGLVALRLDKDQTGPTPLPFDGVVEQLPEVSELPSGIDKSIQQYRGQLQRMGGVNPDAPAEYEETQTRFEFMTQQVEDLNVTEEQLRQVIGELDELTSRAFADTVEKVNEVFGDTFTQLFGGGSARLVLTDPDDLTVSGVDIIARLPNRKEQGLGLLSGGERSLTASALIFSLLKVSPTPFCVMDEVDAALDEANINRFRDILRELSLKTQFVVITHNRGTVQAAQTIYGVSMQ
ncbi:MAG: chromosome segregation protein SMC, partial [Anaerolineaceae bacterium]